MAHYSLLITSAPSSTEATIAAHQFARALSGQGYTLSTIFFYGEGIHHTNSLSTPPSDEYPFYTNWCDIQKTTGCELLVCITAAVKRGVVSDAEATEHSLPASNLQPPFIQAGLGEFFTALHQSQHLVQF